MDESINWKYDFLLRVIGRFDSIIASTNSKCSIVLAFNGIILGAILFRFDEIANIYCNNPYYRNISFLILFLIVLTGSVSIVFAFRAIYPFLKSGETDPKYKSLIFFGSVSKLEASEYLERIISLTDSQMIEDLSKQIKVLADGLQKKMEDMRKAVFLIYVNLVLIILLILLKGVSIYG